MVPLQLAGSRPLAKRGAARRAAALPEGGMSDNGYNPLRWNCRQRGCFNVLCRPKIEVFAKCFPGKGNFGDADGLVEQGGCFGLLEWKTHGYVPLGQQLTFAAFSRRLGDTVFVVEGNAQNMLVRRYCVYFNGRASGWLTASLADVQARVEDWANWARQNRRRTA